jgi:ankyrin repeat protein
MFGAGADVIAYLIRKYSGAVKKTDTMGLTPLHVACDSDSGQDLSLVELLIEAFPEACTIRSKTDGSTPLLLAVARNAPQPVIRALIKANRDPLSIADQGGRIPLHVAVAVKADSETFKLLIEMYPSGLTTKNKANEIPRAFAAKMKLDSSILELLEPIHSQDET